MKNIHSNPTPLRQKFIEYLTLNRKAERTVHCYVSFIHALAKHCRRSPELLSHDDIQHWLYHLIAARKQAPSTVNLGDQRCPFLLRQDASARYRASAPSHQAPPPARPCSQSL